jgi:hypothetical protein
MEMFSDLRQFDEAKKWAEEFAASGRGDQRSVQELINRQAEWSEEVKNYDAAAEMYIKAKKFDRAIAILAKHQWCGGGRRGQPASLPARGRPGLGFPAAHSTCCAATLLRLCAPLLTSMTRKAPLLSFSPPSPFQVGQADWRGAGAGQDGRALPGHVRCPLPQGQPLCVRQGDAAQDGRHQGPHHPVRGGGEVGRRLPAAARAPRVSAGRVPALRQVAHQPGPLRRGAPGLPGGRLPAAGHAHPGAAVRQRGAGGALRGRGLLLLPAGHGGAEGECSGGGQA